MFLKIKRLPNTLLPIVIYDLYSFIKYIPLKSNYFQNPLLVIFNKFISKYFETIKLQKNQINTHKNCGKNVQKNVNKKVSSERKETALENRK